jgi:hypothetical protein
LAIPIEEQDGGWLSYRRAVLDALAKLESGQHELLSDLAKTRTDLQLRIDDAAHSGRERTDQLMQDCNRELVLLRDRIVTLEVTMKFKAGLWGAIAAMIPVAIALFMVAVKNAWR